MRLIIAIYSGISLNGAAVSPMACRKSPQGLSEWLAPPFCLASIILSTYYTTMAPLSLAWDTMIYEQSKEQEQDQKDQDDAQTRDKNTQLEVVRPSHELCLLGMLLKYLPPRSGSFAKRDSNN
ncbi:MAG: hypothetical protein FRX48_02827 [Lasallia pustulata]|uniref:Uncharacterized protein n=1 Tax=Lasallia pustulata TaxID=136370 RepID=A0A5M8PWJ2_9LECA|nr:MAG: hypothetical protein FRX48_02827 [Lasallia pustulata]